MKWEGIIAGLAVAGLNGALALAAVGAMLILAWEIKRRRSA